MIFVYNTWDKFCKKLKNNGKLSIPASEVQSDMNEFIVLKHDIEKAVEKAYKLAEIEKKYGHRGSFYAHAYLLKSEKNIVLLKKMQEMGHEISYHYDVMDSNKGDIDKADIEFENNIRLFEKNGFRIKTVCQHGNPIVERIGYTSNRDFFRNSSIQRKYPNIADIMVNYKMKFNIEYRYYSDAGRKFQLIYDPLNNDVKKSDDKNIQYENLDEMLEKLADKAIISTHPHRWTKSKFEYIVRERLFKLIKAVAKIMMRVPIFRKIMSKYYYLAKKI